ncbi:hypothetical protein F5B20DRAFT_576989 [Whalleya microplaca]|nr:hypothetical protein F5B20DRAFT_576989 [Whalleya microplaca]
MATALAVSPVNRATLVMVNLATVILVKVMVTVMVTVMVMVMVMVMGSWRRVAELGGRLAEDVFLKEA